MRAHFLGVPLDLLSFDDTVRVAVNAMRQRRLVQHVALNVAKLVAMRSDDELRRDVVGSDIVGVDGMGIVWGARSLGIPVPERVAGVDLMERLLAICAEQGFRPYLLGARQDVLQRAMLVAKRRWPGLAVAGSHDGYFRAHEEPAVVADIVSSSADCLFIAMPTPRKERFLFRYREALGVPFIMGVGGALDVLAGHVSRAPVLLQRAGLEWLYRIYQEPRRMWWRYVRTNVVYAWLIGKALASRLLQRQPVAGRA